MYPVAQSGRAHPRLPVNLLLAGVRSQVQILSGLFQSTPPFLRLTVTSVIASLIRGKKIPRQVTKI